MRELFNFCGCVTCTFTFVHFIISGQPLLFQRVVNIIIAAHSRKRPALVKTTFSNSRGGRLRELQLHIVYTNSSMTGKYRDKKYL